MARPNDAFRWRCEAFEMAIGSWHRDPSQQRSVVVRVSVSEQRSPEFALRFDFELLPNRQLPSSDAQQSSGPPERLTRLVTLRQMLKAFEFAFTGSEAKKRRHLSDTKVGKAVTKAEDLDTRVKRWLAGGGRVQAPPREDLAQWLLVRMILISATEDTREADAWVVRLCGEKGAESIDGMEDLFPADSSDVEDESRNENGDENCREESDEDAMDDDFPPPYEEVGYTGSPSSDGEISDEPSGGNGYRHQQQKKAAAVVRPATAPCTSHRSQSMNRFSSHEQPAENPSNRRLSRRSSSTRSLASTLSSSNAGERKEKPVMQATVVQLNPRAVSLDLEKPGSFSKEFTRGGYQRELHESRRYRYEQELHESRRWLQESKEKHDKVQQLAALRHSQLMKEAARQRRINEQIRQDAREVRQMIADTLEYREELRAMEFRVKQASIAAHREQERVKRATRVAAGNSLRGSVEFGAGPPSKREMELMYGKRRDEQGTYDLHGRRRDDGEAGQVAKDTTLESALRKVRRLVLNSEDSVDIFRQYDLDRSGTLSYTEFQSMMHDNGTGNKAELTREQSTALFKHFDADNSGEVDYVELLWGFFNQEAFLKRWRERKVTQAATDQNVKDMFCRRDRTGRGVLSLTEFQIVLEHLGVTLSDVDAKVLSIKFDAGKDGSIDYLGFLDFVNRSGTGELQKRTTRYPDRTQSSSHSSLKSIANTSHGMVHILTELQELTATAEKFQRLLRK
ncbi:hypothetical protein PHYBOEH_006728 [Phytophthora boehmeriae]|uniref:EF-hand domain-containing protein n=1 Tax=Phytophthora boehmeriae TaxID=109152 RepID=A0A8T1X8W1_9STRA|nr:hypothetical protein PHYBOEH_006728 [Phytophthora boehmeriae]